MSPLRMLCLFILIILQADADSHCPAESNPLTLHPPELVVQYGDSVEVNCTSEVSDHTFMEWTNKNETVDTVEDFIVWTVNVSDWDVQAQCRIQLNDGLQCSKDLKITVYQNPYIVVYAINGSYQAEEGQEYQLQCDVNDAAPLQNLTVRWYKGKSIVKNETNSSNMAKTPASASFILKSILSRDDDGVEFTCVAELDLGVGPGIPQEPVNASVSVRVQYPPQFEDVSSIVYVTMGSDVSLDCTAKGNPSPQLQWYHDAEGYMDLSIERNSILNISGINSSATYNCTAANIHGNISKQIYVNVIMTPTMPSPKAMTTPAATKEMTTPATKEMTTPAPDIDPVVLILPARVVVRYGDSVSVNCSTSLPEHDGMGWEAQQGSTDMTENVTYVTWTVESLTNWNIEPDCYIWSNDTEHSKTLPVTLYKTPDAVSISQVNPTGPMLEGTEYQLECRIVQVAPVQNLTVKWYLQNKTIKDLGHAFDADDGRPKDAIDTIRIIPNRTDHGAQYRCEAQLDLGPGGPEPPPTKTSSPLTVHVHYKPVIQHCPSHSSGVEDMFTLSMLHCRADGNPPATVRWYHGGKQINASTPLNRTQSGAFILEAQNNMGQTNMSIDITIEYGPTIACEGHYEVKEKDEIECIPDGKPEPQLTWFKDGQEVIVSHRSFSRRDSGNYTLTATNKHGTTEHMLYIDILYAPEFKQGNTTEEFEPGSDVQLTCIAEGNPPPTVRWNWINATWGRQSTITFKGATSTHAGVYVCLATNEVGNVTRTTTLKMRDKPRVVCPPAFVGVEGHFSLDTVCVVDGYPPADVKWFHKGNAIINASSTMTRNDSGEYVIVASNRLGNATATVFLLVEYPPEFEDVSSIVNVTMGGDVSLDCTAKGNPSPQLQWYHDAEGYMDLSIERSSSILNISGINSSATYYCTAANIHGSRSKRIYVNVIMTPTMPSPKAMTAPAATKELTTPAPDGEQDRLHKWLWIIPPIILSIIVIFLMCYYHRRNRGQYDFQHNSPSSMPMQPLLANGFNSSRA